MTAIADKYAAVARRRAPEVHGAIAEHLEALADVPALLRDSINLRRLHFLPEGLETELVSAAIGEGVSIDSGRR